MEEGILLISEIEKLNTEVLSLKNDIQDVKRIIPKGLRTDFKGIKYVNSENDVNYETRTYLDIQGKGFLRLLELHSSYPQDIRLKIIIDDVTLDLISWKNFDFPLENIYFSEKIKIQGYCTGNSTGLNLCCIWQLD